MAILQENWKDLIKSSNVEIIKKDDKEATFVVQPLEQGYGITLGNALRRVLLTSIRGFAVTSVKIDGVFHEYDSISGIREDVYERAIQGVPRDIFTIAHEIGHAILHDDIQEIALARNDEKINMYFILYCIVKQ